MTSEDWGWADQVSAVMWPDRDRVGPGSQAGVVYGGVGPGSRAGVGYGGAE